MSDWFTFVKWELASRETIDFKMVYVDIAGGDILAGLLLSQIIYWNLPTKDGRSRLQVQKEGKLWLARKHSDWYQEIRMSEDQVRRALSVLQDLQLVEVKRFKFDGNPTTHISLNRNLVAHAIKNILQTEKNNAQSQCSSVLGLNPEGTGIEPKTFWDKTQLDLGQNPVPLTEITTEITNIDTNTPFNPPMGEVNGKGSLAFVSDEEIKTVVDKHVKAVKKSRSKKERQFSEDGIPLPKHDPEGFLRWIRVYPKQTHLASAANEWDSIKPKPAMVDLFVSNSETRAKKDADWVKDGGKYIPNPEAYLKGCRWTDKFTEVTVSGGSDGVRVSYQNRYPSQQSDEEVNAMFDAGRKRWEAKQAAMRQNGQNLTDYEGVTVDAFAI